MSGPYRRHLEVLDVAQPCAEDWAKMDGDDRVRFCLKCANNVYDLSELTIGETHQLLELREGRVCVRLHRRKDGTLVTADCAPKRRAFYARMLRRHTALAAVTATCLSAAAALVSVFADALAATHPTRLGPMPTPSAPRPPALAAPDDETVVMGLLVERNPEPRWVDPQTLTMPRPDGDFQPSRFGYDHTIFIAPRAASRPTGAADDDGDDDGDDGDGDGDDYGDGRIGVSGAPVE